MERLRAASRELEANRLRKAEDVIAQLKQELAGNLKENKRRNNRRVSDRKTKSTKRSRIMKSIKSLTGKWPLEQLTVDNWNTILAEYTEIVFSRTIPEQKMLIVEETKKRGDNVVSKLCLDVTVVQVLS